MTESEQIGKLEKCINILESTLHANSKLTSIQEEIIDNLQKAVDNTPSIEEDIHTKLYNANMCIRMYGKLVEDILACKSDLPDTHKRNSDIMKYRMANLVDMTPPNEQGNVWVNK